MTSGVRLLQFLHHFLSSLNWFLKLPRGESFCAEVGSYRHGVRSCRLMRQEPEVRIKAEQTGYQTLTELCAIPHTLLLGPSQHTHQEKLPHLIPEISPKPPPFSAEVLSVLYRSDKLSFHTSLPSTVWLPSPPPVPMSDRLLFIF